MEISLTRGKCPGTGQTRFAENVKHQKHKTSAYWQRLINLILLEVELNSYRTNASGKQPGLPAAKSYPLEYCASDFSLKTLETKIFGRCSINVITSDFPPTPTNEQEKKRYQRPAGPHAARPLENGT